MYPNLHFDIFISTFITFIFFKNATVTEMIVIDLYKIVH